MGDTDIGSSEGLCFLCFCPTLHFLDISKQHSNSYIFLGKYRFWPVTETKVTTCRDFFRAQKRKPEPVPLPAPFLSVPIQTAAGQSVLEPKQLPDHNMNLQLSGNFSDFSGSTVTLSQVSALPLHL